MEVRDKVIHKVDVIIKQEIMEEKGGIRDRTWGGNSH